MSGRMDTTQHISSYGITRDDTVILLRFFLPKGEYPTKTKLASICRTLHLAFKQMNADELYNVLAHCLILALNKYDPDYSSKVALIVKTINGELKEKKSFSIEKVTEVCGFDTKTFLRLLRKKGFLTSIRDAKSKMFFFSRTDTWPPPKSFLNAGPVGLPYFLSKRFRLFLRCYITRAMSQLETKQGVMQLEHRKWVDRNAEREVVLQAVPNAEGSFITRKGTSLHADTDLWKDRTEDIGHMSMDWIHKAPKHMEQLSKQERLLLFLIYKQEKDWKDAAKTLGMSMVETKELYKVILSKLRSAFQVDIPVV